MATKLDKTKMIRNLAKRHKLVTHLDRALDGFDEPWTYTYTSKVPDDAWHPSGHCMPAPSALYYMIKNPGPDTGSGSMAKAFQVGHFWHQLLQHVVLTKLGFCEPEDIERRGLTVFTDGPTPGPYCWATGSGDIAPCHIPHHGDYVVDFKTMAPQQFNQQGVPAWASAKYEAQINIYMEFFDLEKGLIVAIDKGSSEMKEFEYTRNQNLIDWVYNKWAFVSECLDQNVSPQEIDDEMFADPPCEGPIAQ